MRKNLVILLALMLVVAIPCALVQGTETITLDKTYSNFGLSFKYPNGMTLLETGLHEVRANDASGVILGELDEDQLLMLSWMKTLYYDLELSLEGGFMAMEKEIKKEEEITSVRGEKGETTVNGHKVLYQFLHFSGAGETIYGIFGTWYCDVSEKQYMLGIMFNEPDIFPLFEDYLDSFICHQVQVAPTPTPVPEPEFEHGGISISPTSVEKGKAVTIKADITNVGKADGSTIVNLKVNDLIVDSKEVTLDANETKAVKFIHIAEDETGTYIVGIDDEVGSYEVTPGFEAVFAIVGLLAVAYLLRRKK